MGCEYDDLPGWEFTVAEASPGIYLVTARRDGGIHGDATGTDPDTTLEELKSWAKGTDEGLGVRDP